MSEKTNVLLIGATGPMGRAVLARNDPRVCVRALARNPQALAGVADDVVAGDVRDRDGLVAALDGIDVVVSCLGSKPFTADSRDLLEVGTGNLMDAMTRVGCGRLIVVTGMGAGDSKGHGPWYYDYFARPLILRTVYADKDRQEEAIRATDLDWTVVRPSMLVKKTPDKPVRVKAELAPGEKMGPIDRTDVAKFLLAEAVAPAHSRETVHLYT
ncbi:MAG: NAD(P)H-binding protein [Gordonia sp. (in: high G+C Gram-positive bacteria)]|uniref:NAD(P)-dependent oxidoreductase n=1 Tax=Gordonia sp. (in: high G+C Gram-positive bacteria) TaxID=84139 RepID=UPI0039E457EB